MLKQSRILAQQVIFTRKWAAGHEGVYVVKRPGDMVNPYIYKVGPARIIPEVTDSEGRTLILKNPSLVTRELSEITSKAGLVSYRLTSLNPVNPQNLPDSFEQIALQRFEKGLTEIFKTVHENGKGIFRYMLPLRVEEACLKCHGFQGYKVGDIRGGLSLNIPMEAEIALMHEKKQGALTVGIMMLAFTMLTLVLGSHYLIIRPVGRLSEFADTGLGGEGKLPDALLERKDEVGALARSMQSSSNEIHDYRNELERLVAERTSALEKAKAQLEELSRTDPLTGLNNRRHLQAEAPKLLSLSRRQKAPVAIMMVDIDRFKNFNDDFGHEAGDRALVHTAILLRKSLRPYDLLVRYGGEEFLLILPIITLPESEEVAERLRSDVENTPVMVRQKEIPVTISIGLYVADDVYDLEEAVNRADEALYRAKNEGRNRVIVDSKISLNQEDISWPQI
jgi:diguanylate cyclase (GGDEF)-like protein